jgi:hypothetical protein
MKEVFPTAEQVKAGFDHGDKRFNAVEERLERSENILLATQEARIEKLEAQMQAVRESLAI